MSVAHRHWSATLCLCALVLAPGARVLGAQDLDVVRICAAIANEGSRLNCYDRLVSSLGVSPAGPEGDLWVVEFNVDPVTDARSARAILPALEGAGSDDQPIRFILECREGRTEVLMDWAQFIGDRPSVTLRVDSDEPQVTAWEVGPNRSAARYRNDAGTLARAIALRRRLVARVTPPQREPVTAVFDLTGMPDAMRPVQEACGW